MVLCAGAFGCYAAQGSLPGAQGQGYDLNLSYSRTTLKAVADAITQQVGIAFSYETALAGYPMENLEVSEKGATILAAVFTPRGIDYRVVDKVVVLTRSTRPVPAASAAAKSEVKGVVRDAAGNPMIGVTVTIKGTLVGVSTGVDGGYAIPADGNATLLFSYIGYRPHEEVVGRRTQIDVTMQEDELVMVTPNTARYQALLRRGAWGRELLGEPTIAREQGSGTDRTLQRYMARMGYDPRDLHIVARLDDPETIKRMVTQGAGVSVLSALSVRQERKDGRALVFPMDGEGLRRTIYLAHRQNLACTAGEKQFLSFVQGYYQK